MKLRFFLPLCIVATSFAIGGGALLLSPRTVADAETEGAAAVRALESHLSAVVPQAMAQAHRLLIDRHSAAGLDCKSCHGDAAFTEPVAEAACVQCHGTYSDLAARTPWEPNPHRSHMGELACSTCHTIHKPSVSFCDQCHSFGMQVP